MHAKVDNSSSFFCTLCDYKDKKKIKLMEHFSRQHKHIDKYRCDKCDFTTHNNVNLVRHMERVHMGLSYSCKLCDGVFNRESGWKLKWNWSIQTPNIYVTNVTFNVIAGNTFLITSEEDMKLKRNNVKFASMVLKIPVNL